MIACDGLINTASVLLLLLLQYHIRQHSQGHNWIGEGPEKGDKEVSEGDRGQEDESTHHFEILHKLGLKEGDK